MAIFVRQRPSWTPQCPFCNQLISCLFTLFLHCIRIHLDMRCRLCGELYVGYLSLVYHFVRVHMEITITRRMDVFRIGTKLREIPLCERSLDDMQLAAMSLSQIILRYRDTMSHAVPASHPAQSLNVHFSIPSGTYTVAAQIVQNIVVTRQNQSPGASQSLQEEHTQSVQDCTPLVNQLNDPTEEIIHVEDSDDEEIDLD